MTSGMPAWARARFGPTAGTDELLAQRGEPVDRAVLDAVTTVFLAEGFAGLDHDELARRTGFARRELAPLGTRWEDLVERVVGDFLRSAAFRVELRATGLERPRDRLIAYLDALSVELSAVGERFYADLEHCRPGLAVYRLHTQRAAARVQALVGEGISAGELRPVNSRFVGAILLSVLTAIQRGEIEATACLGDTRAYSLLTDLLLHGIDHGPYADG